MQSINSTKGTFPVSSTDSRKPNILRRRPALRSPNSVEQNVNVSSKHSEEIKLTAVDIPKSTNKANNRRCNTKETRSNSKTQNSSQKIVLDSYFCDKYRKAQESSNCKISFSIPLANQDLQTINDKILNSNTVINGTTNENVENAENVELPIEVVFSGENNTITLNGLNHEQVLAGLESGQFGVGQVLVGEGADQVQYWFCPIINCNKLYNEKSDLHVHILTHFDLKSFKCNIDDCSQEFINEDLLKQHCDNVHVKHDDKNSDKISPVVSYIISIKGNDDGEPRYIVDAALASVGITEDQLISVQHPDGNRHWVCPQIDCDLQFKALHLLKSHILMHYDLRPFKCDYEGCSWGFRYLHKLKKHLNVHKVHNKTTFACTHTGCSKAFSTKYNLSVHMKVHEKKPEGIPCPARACTLLFTSRADLETHLEEHTLDDAVHCCTSCGKRFWRSTALASHHARAHANSPVKPVCPWPRCGRKFTQPCQLRYHIRSHTGDKPYRCTYPSCDKAFSYSSKLSRHARQHSKVKEGRYICRECCRAFVRPDNLKEHLLRHMAQNSHQCDYPGCDQKFCTERSLHAHKKKEHGTNIKNKTEQIKIVDNISELRNSPTDFISMESCDDDLLYLRSARTHVPWSPDVTCDLQSPLLPQDSGLLLQQRSRDEKRGNPLVCGGLSLDSDGSAANAGLILETSESAISSLPELETDLLESTGDHMNSLLLQEELTDGMLYTTEEEAALQVLLLNEDPAP